MILRIAFCLFALAAAPALAQPLSPVAPAVREIAGGVHLLPGAMLPGRGPDGNTVLFAAPEGLIVVDTGRHAWHADAILAFAESQRRPIAAIVNTHWHLDHSSGNRRLQARYPNAVVYTTAAVDRALAPGGFIARERERTPDLLNSPDLTPVQREEVHVFLQTMENAESLRPGVAIEEAARMRIAGRRLDVRVTEGAVTDADLWLYDRRTRIVVLGDLVTFPAPFFETACPNAWRTALDDVWATGFRLAIPGHGEPMTRPQFDVYRTAFNAFLDCVDGNAESAICSAAWVDGIAQFLEGDPARRQAAAYADYYVDFLRQNGGKSRDCLGN